MGEETAAARDRVLAARGDLADEVERLEASARASVDIRKKVQRNPARTAAVVGGGAFLVLGGPRRLIRRGRRFVMGPEPTRPKSLLPEEIDKSLDRLGAEGDRLRDVLQQDFKEYLEHQPKRRSPNPTIIAAAIAPFIRKGSLRAAEWFFRPSRQSFQAELARIRARAAPGEPVSEGALDEERPEG